MFDLFKKLLMAGQIKFEEGNIIFMNSRVLISPAELFANLMDKFKDDENICLEFYRASKFTHIKGFAEEVSKKYNIKNMSLVKWLVDSANMGGWGKMKFIAEDDSEKMFILEVSNSISKNMKSDVPMDHFLRGQIAGGASATFGSEFDCIERKCIASGDDCCEFVVKPREIIIKNGISKKFVNQIFTENEIKKLKVKLLK